MKTYKVKSLINFFDREENINRIEKEEFYCTKERYEFLKEHNAVELLEVAEEIIKKVEEPKEVEPKELIKINNKKVVKKKTTKK